MDIVLRPLCVEDTQFMYEVENDPRVWDYSSLGDAPYTVLQIGQYCLERDGVLFSAEVGDYRYVIECDGVGVGFLDLYDVECGIASVGILVYSEQRRGCGIGGRALELLVAECSGVGIHSLCAFVSEVNFVGLRFFESCGFERGVVDDTGVVSFLRIL